VKRLTVALLFLFVAAVPLAAAATGARQVTFEFQEIWLDPEDIYEEDGTVYADGYLVMEALNLDELTLSSLPLLRQAAGGSLTIENLSMTYLDDQRIAQMDPGGDYGFDEYTVKIAATLVLDATAAKAVLGFSDREIANLEDTWEEKGDEVVTSWLDAIYDAYDRLDCALAYEDDLVLSPEDGGIFEVDVSGGPGGVEVEILAVGWGLEALAGRLFEAWTNVGYWMYDLVLSGTIGADASDLYMETAVAYLLYEYRYPYPDNYTCWIWEACSLLPPGEDAAAILGHSEDYLEYTVDYEGVPTGWTLRDGEAITFVIPSGWQPKPWWEPYGPTELAASWEREQGTRLPFALGTRSAHYLWKDNVFNLHGPMDMVRWSQEHNSLGWAEASGMPFGAPYLEIVPGNYYFHNSGLIAGSITFLYILLFIGLYLVIKAFRDLPNKNV
jgi:hypothetical protein